MKSHELARKLLDLPDVDIMQPMPGTENELEIIEDMDFIPKGEIEEYPACIILRGAYHIRKTKEYRDSLNISTT
jgi:hypothetical protein